MGASHVGADPVCQFLGAEQASWLDDGALAVHPLGFHRMEPGTLDRQGAAEDPHTPGKTVGPTFEIFRCSYILPHRAAAWAILLERLLELADGAAAVNQLFASPEDAAATTVLTDVESSLRKLAETFAQAVAEG